MRTVVLSYNWFTGELRSNSFSGPESSQRAKAFIVPNSRHRLNYPASKGWEHFIHTQVATATPSLL